MRELREIRVRFGREVVEISSTYAHDEGDLDLPTPGTKKRTATAARMARAGLVSGFCVVLRALAFPDLVTERS